MSVNDWQFWEEHWNETMEKNLKEIVRKENPMAKLIGKMGVDSLTEKVTLVYKTRVSTGEKVLFYIPEEESKELEKQEPSKKIIKWMGNLN